MAKAEVAARAAAPVTTFRVSTYYKRGRNEAGITSKESKRLALSEVLDWVLSELDDDAVTIESNTADSDITTLVIDWSKVPGEIRDPMAHGAKR